MPNHRGAGPARPIPPEQQAEPETRRPPSPARNRPDGRPTRHRRPRARPDARDRPYSAAFTAIGLLGWVVQFA